MNIMQLTHRSKHKQRGAIALAVGLILLFAATILTIFAAKVGIQEQRISGNEYRSKMAFEASQAGMDYGQSYLKQNLKTTHDAINKDTNYVAGEWIKCSESRPTVDWNDSLDQFCQDAGNPPSWLTNRFWFEVPFTTQPDDISIAYRVFYFANEDPSNAGNLPGMRDIQVTVVAEGASDIPTGSAQLVNNGVGYAFMKVDTVTQSVLAGPPKAPLTASANTAAAWGSGNFTIVTNPNGGGKGVPLTAWVDGDCDLDKSSSQTCYPHDFYTTKGTPFIYDSSDPNDKSNVYDFGLEHGGDSDDIVLCHDCECTKDSGDLLTDKVRGEGIDILDKDGNHGENPDLTYFPSDLFEYFFGVTKTEEATDHTIENQSVIINNCMTDLKSSSSGLYWAKDSSCSINGTVGSPTDPVLLIIEGGASISSNAIFYGMIFVLEHATENLTMNGGATVYGAVVSDRVIKSNGTNNLVYHDKVLANLDDNLRTPKAVPGSWADF